MSKRPQAHAQDVGAAGCAARRGRRFGALVGACLLRGRSLVYADALSVEEPSLALRVRPGADEQRFFAECLEQAVTGDQLNVSELHIPGNLSRRLEFCEEMYAAALRSANSETGSDDAWIEERRLESAVRVATRSLVPGSNSTLRASWPRSRRSSKSAVRGVKARGKMAAPATEGRTKAAACGRWWGQG